MNKIYVKLVSIIVLSSLLLTPFTNCSSFLWKEKIKDFITAKPALSITMGCCLIGFGLTAYITRTEAHDGMQKDNPPSPKNDFYHDWFQENEQRSERERAQRSRREEFLQARAKIREELAKTEKFLRKLREEQEEKNKNTRNSNFRHNSHNFNSFNRGNREQERAYNSYPHEQSAHRSNQADLRTPEVRKAYEVLNINEYSNGFAILNIPNLSPTAEIKKAYHKLAKLWHPDKFEINKAAKKIAENITKEVVEEVFKLISIANVACLNNNGRMPSKYPENQDCKHQ